MGHSIRISNSRWFIVSWYVPVENAVLSNKAAKHQQLALRMRLIHARETEITAEMYAVPLESGPYAEMTNVQLLVQNCQSSGRRQVSQHRYREY